VTAHVSQSPSSRRQAQPLNSSACGSSTPPSEPRTSNLEFRANPSIDNHPIPSPGTNPNNSRWPAFRITVRTPPNWLEKQKLTRLLTNRDGPGPSPGQAREYVEQLSLPPSPPSHPSPTPATHRRWREHPTEPTTTRASARLTVTLNRHGPEPVQVLPVDEADVSHHVRVRGPGPWDYRVLGVSERRKCSCSFVWGYRVEWV
jgi:hypothetical protein